MYKYIKVFEEGFIDGVKDAIRMKYKNRKFKRINELEILSKLYDVGYIKGYKKTSLKKD